MKINHPDCRVWTASQQLRQALPPWWVAPHRTSDVQPIDVYKANGLNWIASQTCEWHSDWHEMFSFLVVRGSATLYIANEVDCNGDNVPSSDATVLAKCRIRRGDIIQLWPLRYHRVEVDRPLSTIEHSMGNVETRSDAFMYSPPVMEGAFLRKIREKYEGPV